MKVEVNKAVTSAQTTMRVLHQDELLAASINSRKKEQEIEIQFKKRDALKDGQLKTLNTQLATALSELHKRPSRASTPNPTQVTSVTASCTGTQLFKEDGQFLAREAARGDKVIIERDYYYQQYEEARKMLNEYSNSH
ncbi:MAG TPA: hypothetical protein VFQ47_10540 [Nitrososphaera sp.]|nr:hypothetical protein [Nitrososphaera sp.]